MVRVPSFKILRTTGLIDKKCLIREIEWLSESGPLLWILAKWNLKFLLILKLYVFQYILYLSKKHLTGFSSRRIFHLQRLLLHDSGRFKPTIIIRSQYGLNDVQFIKINILSATDDVNDNWNFFWLLMLLLKKMEYCSGKRIVISWFHKYLKFNFTEIYNNNISRPIVFYADCQALVLLQAIKRCAAQIAACFPFGS